MTKSVTLYDHTSEFVQIKQALEDDPDIDGPAIENLLQEISGQIEDKIRGAAAVIDEWALEKEAAEILRKRIQSRERAISNRIDRLKSWLLFNMERGGITQIKAVDHCVNYCAKFWTNHYGLNCRFLIPSRNSKPQNILVGLRDKLNVDAKFIGKRISISQKPQANIAISGRR